MVPWLFWSQRAPAKSLYTWSAQICPGGNLTVVAPSPDQATRSDLKFPSWPGDLRPGTVIGSRDPITTGVRGTEPFLRLQRLTES
jgi:hypothetical protein